MKFALITEGASEHRIIKHIISKYFKEQEPDINQIQPKLVNDKQETTGGWNEVLKYCEREELNAILVENDYLIIQIDTDQSPNNPFNVSHTKKGQLISDEELHTDIIAKLKSLIKPDIMQKHGERILFAVCIHTIECWLLPLFYNDKNRAKTATCLDILNKKLVVNKITPITAANKNKPNGIRSYATVLKEMKKKTEIIEHARHNIGFEKFIDSLNIIVVS